MSHELSSPHDAFFKSMMGREDVARKYIQHYLPMEITSHMDLDTLEVDTQGYVDEELKTYFSDMVATVQLTDGQLSDIYILFEHKSGLNRLTRLQILKYMVRKWSKWIADKTLDPGYLPIIIPVVVYHGRQKWNYGLEFSDLFRLPSAFFRLYIPKFEHILHDISHVDDEKFKTSVDVRVFQLLLKYFFRPELNEKLPEIISLLLELDDKNKITEYLPVIIRYILSAKNVSVAVLKAALKGVPKGEETMESTADQLRQEGHDIGFRIGEQKGIEIGEQKGIQIGEQKGIQIGEQKGIQIGEQRAIQALLLEAVEEKFGVIHPTLVSKIKMIESPETLKGLYRRLLKINTLQEFSMDIDRILTPL